LFLPLRGEQFVLAAIEPVQFGVPRISNAMQLTAHPQSLQGAHGGQVIGVADGGDASQLQRAERGRQQPVPHCRAHPQSPVAGIDDVPDPAFGPQWHPRLFGDAGEVGVAVGHSQPVPPEHVWIN